MVKRIKSLDYRMALSAICFALLQAFFVYLFYLQTPVQSRREWLFTLLLWFGLIPLNFLLIKRFLLPKLQTYSPRGQIGWVLLSALIGLLAVISIPKTPFFISLLPNREILIEIPTGNPDRSVSLYWFSTSIGDIGFSQIDQFGGWEQTDSGLSHLGGDAATLKWAGRTGDASKLVFVSGSTPVQLKITVDGRTQPVELSGNPDSPVSVENDYPVNLPNRLFAILALWFTTTFLFLVITLFLVHLPVKLPGIPGEQIRRVELALKSASTLLFRKEPDRFWSGRDWAVISIFFFIAVLFFMGRWNGLSPFIDLHSDASYVSAYAASLDHPEAFSNDSLFNSRANFGYYTSLQVPLIRLLTKFTGDYGFSYIVLLLPFVFFQLFGFYILGRLLFKTRFFAFLLSLITIPVYYAQAGDYWGVWIDPQPRMMFQAAFPWLLALVVFSIPRPRLRWLVMISLGLMIYVHPISIPGVAFAIWLGYLVFKPAGLKWQRHLINQLLYALIFLLFTFPFIFQYTQNRDLSTATSMDYATTGNFLKQLFPSSFEIRAAFIRFTTAANISFLLPLAYLGAVIVFRHHSERQKLGLVLTWISGILLVTVGLNSFEVFLESKTLTLPVLIEMVRGLRYVIPLMQILVIWPLALWWCGSEYGTGLAILRRLGLAMAGLGVFVLFINSFPKTFTVQFPNFAFPDYHYRTFQCLKVGKIVCPNPDLIDAVAVLNFLRDKTDSGQAVISIPPVDMSGAVRFYALRPVAFDAGDLTRLAPGNISAAIDLQDDITTWSSINNLPEDQQLTEYLEFAAGLQADFVIVRNPVPTWALPRVAFTNSTYSILELR